MSTNTRIEWTGPRGATWNPLAGCTRVSEGCRHCYAERMAARIASAALAKLAGAARSDRVNEKQRAYMNVVRWREGGRDGPLATGDVALPQWSGRVELIDDALTLPLRWRNARRILVNSMSDLFHEDVPDDFIDRVSAIMALCPQHVFQVLTKRPERMANMLPRRLSPEVFARAFHVAGSVLGKDEAARRRSLMRAWSVRGGPMPNLWVGTSVEDQAAADKRIPWLLRCTAAVRFISAEPLLGPIEMRDGDWAPGCLRLPWLHGVVPIGRAPTHADRGIDWVIVGGESGPGARPMHPDWVREIRDRCAAAAVPFVFKQWGAWSHQAHGPTHVVCRCGHWDVWSDDRVAKHIHVDGCTESSVAVRRVGKKRAGRLLDGVEHNGMPAWAARNGPEKRPKNANTAGGKTAFPAS